MGQGLACAQDGLVLEAFCLVEPLLGDVPGGDREQGRPPGFVRDGHDAVFEGAALARVLEERRFSRVQDLPDVWPAQGGGLGVEEVEGVPAGKLGLGALHP